MARRLSVDEVDDFLHRLFCTLRRRIGPNEVIALAFEEFDLHVAAALVVVGDELLKEMARVKHVRGVLKVKDVGELDSIAAFKRPHGAAQGDAPVWRRDAT